MNSFSFLLVAVANLNHSEISFFLHLYQHILYYYNYYYAVGDAR